MDESRLFSVVNHLQGINLNATELDVKGVAFERFLGSYFKGDMGQYFTPREVVEFMVKMAKPNHEERVLRSRMWIGRLSFARNGLHT